jgi:hypothetical protein
MPGSTTSTAAMSAARSPRLVVERVELLRHIARLGGRDRHTLAGVAHGVGQDLAATLEQLGHAGLDDFYRGDVGREVAADLERAGSPVTRIAPSRS